MRKAKYIMSFITGLLLLLSVIIFMLFGRTQQADSQETETVQSQVQDYDYKYILKEYNGNIGIFLPSESTPTEILDIDVKLLPEQDQQSLKQGIEVEDDNALKQYIEDFDG